MRNNETMKASEITTNVRRCKCYLDNSTILEKGEGYGFFVPARGLRYICRNCKEGLHSAVSYHTSARQGYGTVGTEKSGKLESTKIGVEFEMMFVDDINDLTLLDYLRKLGRIENDSSLFGFEIPSATMQGLKTLSKALEYIEREGFLPSFNNEQCGAHIHGECHKVEYLRRYYHSVFVPLAEYIDSLGRDKRMQYFGSDFRYYARMINRRSEPTLHENMFNLQHAHTIEFRLPRITGKHQYMNVAKFWREVAYTINTFEFCESAVDNETRLARAQECGTLLVEVAKKYYA